MIYRLWCNKTWCIKIREILVDNVDDAKEFRETQYALTLLGVGSKQQSLVLRVLAAILHLGNVELIDTGSDSTKVDQAQPALGYVCELLGVEKSQLSQWLCHRRIQEMVHQTAHGLNSLRQVAFIDP